MENQFWFVYPNGANANGTEDTENYNFTDLFPGLFDIWTATDADLREAYVGADCDGISVRWAAP